MSIYGDITQWNPTAKRIAAARLSPFYFEIVSNIERRKGK
jgi:hypothetical protein